ncbi:MAG: sulfotransferase [Phycisphaerales bacterium]|nr:sulfotransferase [Hyphomonadaceae bacterium]
MKLNARFIQLPVAYDVERLRREIEALGDDAWRPHPEGFQGNDFIPLIAANGEPADESFEGPMRPTEHLKQCPYLIDVLASLGAALGRTRLMRLGPHADVNPHVDVNYYWRDRMRVHVPIITQPAVRFYCGDKDIHMAAGECWIFDTWSLHRVENNDERNRIHLVADTVGGESFWDLAARGKAVGFPAPPNWSADKIEPSNTPVEKLDLETVNTPTVMSPWEVSDHLTFLLNEAEPNQPAIAPVRQAVVHFLHKWRALWSIYGESRDGWPRYRKALNQFMEDMKAAQAHTIRLRNRASFASPLSYLVLSSALADTPRNFAIGEVREDPNAPAPGAGRLSMPSEPDPQFERPIFIVNPPRSGSSLLFETLLQAPGLYTVGGESHNIIEGIPAFNLAAQKFASNRLGREHALPGPISTMRLRFLESLRDRDNRPPGEGRIRMLEKTPKNALRIPLLRAAFPEARFIYLYRDPREVLASMMEAWESGRFRTYPTLPGWTGKRAWSLLLTPGWKDLGPLPLNEVVAGQWSASTEILLTDLGDMPPDRWTVARYDALIANPDEEVRRLCAAMDLEWDRTLGAGLPLARHTVSQPEDGKWRAREDEIMSVLSKLEPLLQRAADVAKR